MFIRTALALSLAALPLAAQAPAPLTPAEQPTLQALSAAVRTARRNSTATDEIKAQVDKLTTQATADQTAGHFSDARRNVAHAWSLLRSQPWDDKQEFAWSLALRADRIVSDPSLPFLAHVSQFYSAPYKGASPLRVRASLVAPKPRELGVFPVASRDLIEQPFGFDADLNDLADGAYRLRAELLDGDAVVATLEQPVQFVKGIDSERAAVERRLAKIQGHEGAKGTIRYPFQLARTVNAGRRQFSTADFGIPWDPQQAPYDFVQGVHTSLDLLKSLEAGKDPVLRAKGDHERHYWFEEGGEPMAYRLYVPTKWDGRSKLPMVLVLHGNTRDQDYYFDRDNGILAKLAEQHGYLVVAPMGYRPSAGWGSSRQKQSELSEQDALHVLDLVTKEYNVDTTRTFLFGHSAGGAGTWHLGEKYPQRWAAIAASAAATRADGFPFDHLKGVPVMVCHGDKDDEVPVTSSRNMVKGMKDHGFDPIYLEVPGATHLTVVAIVEPKVFDFFDQVGKNPRTIVAENK